MITEFLAAVTTSATTGRTQTVVIEQRGGGTAWWLLLLIAIVAAVASYYAAWRLKKADVNRESAFRAIEPVDEAQRVAAADAYRQNPKEVADEVLSLLQEGRARAYPLGDRDLDDRFKAATSCLIDMQMWQGPPGREWHWLREAVATVRAGLVPHLSAPKFVGRRPSAERWFPTFEELNAMDSDPSGRDPNVRLDALIDWRAKPPSKKR